MRTMATSLQGAHLPNNDSSESMSGLVPPLSPCVMPELAAINNETTSLGRLPGLRKGSPKPKSSKTLGLVLTSTDEGLRPYWSDACQGHNLQLWLPILTDCVDLDSSLSSGLWNETAGKSWFSGSLQNAPLPKSLRKIYLQSLPSSPQECLGSQSIVTKSRKIKLKPTPQQKAMFKQWFAGSRFLYNKTIEHLKTLDGPRPHWTVVKVQMMLDLPQWLTQVPYQVKSMAVSEACDSLSRGKMAVKRGQVARFNLSFKSRREPKQSCFIPSTAIGPKGIYPRLSGQLYYCETLPSQHRDSRLVLENGEYFLAVAFKAPAEQNERKPSSRLVALDPGVRSFLTFYSQDNCGKIGDQSQQRLVRLMFWLDKLVSKQSTARGQLKRRLKLAAGRLRRKISNLTDELHWKAIRFLTKNYEAILLPILDTKALSLRASRRLRKKSVRAMLGLGHGLFRTRLEAKCKELGIVLRYVREDYTSKTCSWSGETVKIGSRSVITGTDGVKMDRDINGARGILLRALVDTPSNFQFEHAVNLC